MLSKGKCLRPAEQPNFLDACVLYRFPKACRSHSFRCHPDGLRATLIEEEPRRAEMTPAPCLARVASARSHRTDHKNRGPQAPSPAHLSLRRSDTNSFRSPIYKESSRTRKIPPPRHAISSRSTNQTDITSINAARRRRRCSAAPKGYRPGDPLR
jgi:hypothetical protein